MSSFHDLKSEKTSDTVNNQIPAVQNYIQKTMFEVHDGHYEYQKFPFGLINVHHVSISTHNK